MYQKFKQYFEISRREFRGMIVFIIIIFVIYISPYVYEKLTFEPVKITLQTLQPKIVAIEKFKPSTSYSNESASEVEAISKGVLFNFNPNNLPLEDWMKLGLSEKQARSIKNYEAKGGQFKSKADVKKMYAIKPELYVKLEPYIQIPASVNPNFTVNKGQSFSKTTTPPVMVDINNADSTALLNIRGVGPAFAARIIKFRERLGGFYDKQQLRDIYGIDSIKYAQIAPQISLDKIVLRQIKINECNFEDLKPFPYLSFKQMNAIIAYRKQHGNYKAIDDLSKIAILNPEIIQKIAPYLSF